MAGFGVTTEEVLNEECLLIGSSKEQVHVAHDNPANLDVLNRTS
jgi:hypothetical protein